MRSLAIEQQKRDSITGEDTVERGKRARVYAVRLIQSFRRQTPTRDVAIGEVLPEDPYHV